MSRFQRQLMPGRASRSLRTRPWALLMLGVFAVACDDPAAPEMAVPNRPSLIKEVDGKVGVFNLQLRAVEDPNIVPSDAYGHLQLTLTRNADGTYLLESKGQIFNPAGESFTGWALNDLDNGQPPLRFRLSAIDGGITDRQIDPEDATIISAEVANRLFGTPDTIDDPNLLIATFFTTQYPAGAIRGERALPAGQ